MRLLKSIVYFFHINGKIDNRHKYLLKLKHA